MPDLAVRILDETVAVEQEAGGKVMVQFATPRLVHGAAAHAGPEQRQFALAERALDAQHQAVVMTRRRKHLVPLDQQRVGGPAPFQQLEPLDRVPRKP